MSALPKVSIIIPTYNCAPLLAATFAAIAHQGYPAALIERLIIDGGSTDGTLELATQYGWRVIHNPARSNLYGLPLGFAAAKGDLILHLDDDNVLDRPDWLRRMVKPFTDATIVAAEPLYYHAPASENEITRYVGLIGADDPLVVYAGFHDKWSRLTHSWTGVPHDTTHHPGYMAITFSDHNRIPSLACNGFMVRRHALMAVVRSPWLHMDAARRLLAPRGRRWAKVKVGIINHHAPSLKDFWIKKWRRMATRSREAASFEYQYPLSATQVLMLTLRCVTIVPLVIDAARGWWRKPDPVWLLHPLLTLGTVVVYGVAYLYFRGVAADPSPLKISQHS